MTKRNVAKNKNTKQKWEKTFNNNISNHDGECDDRQTLIPLIHFAQEPGL